MYVCSFLTKVTIITYFHPNKTNTSLIVGQKSCIYHPGLMRDKNTYAVTKVLNEVKVIIYFKMCMYKLNIKNY